MNLGLPRPCSLLSVIKIRRQSVYLLDLLFVGPGVADNSVSYTARVSATIEFPAILTILCLTGLDDQAKRAECEEKEMMGCLASSHERCTKFARETCDPIFANMRIAAPGVVIDPRFTSKRLLRQKISRHDKITPKVPAEKNLSCDKLEQVPLSQIVPDNVSMPELKQSSVTNFYGRQLMRDDKLDVWERKSPVWNNLNKEENVTTPGTTDGWVGGLVRPEYGSEEDKISSGRHRGISDILKTVRPEWWQKFQHSLIERFSF